REHDRGRSTLSAGASSRRGDVRRRDQPGRTRGRRRRADAAVSDDLPWSRARRNAGRANGEHDRASTGRPTGRSRCHPNGRHDPVPPMSARRGALPGSPRATPHLTCTMVELATLLLAIAVILITTRAVSSLFRRLNQPPVIGEMVAGIMLGPSLLGWVAPDISSALFPTQSQALLEGLSALGLVLFMFLVGMEHDPVLMRGRGPTAVLISHASMTIPFALGMVLALFLYPRLGEQHVSFTQFALFIGTSVSITAFPVLARMLVDSGLARTPVGVLALTAAAVNDVTGWLALAAVLPMMGVGRDPHGLPLWLSIPGTVLFALLMLTV